MKYIRVDIEWRDGTGITQYVHPEGIFNFNAVPAWKEQGDRITGITVTMVDHDPH